MNAVNFLLLLQIHACVATITNAPLIIPQMTGKSMDQAGKHNQASPSPARDLEYIQSVTGGQASTVSTQEMTEPTDLWQRTFHQV